MKILSLGAGVQSSTLIFMADRGLLDTIPDVAIFADTQDEPDEVYDWLRFLRQQIHNIPIVCVTKGRLSEAALRIRTSKNTNETYTKPQIPVFTLYPNGRKGKMARHCTVDYKLEIIRREAKRLCATKKERIEMWIGISTDEATRMKDSSDKRIDHVYPIIEKGMSRTDCLAWFAERGLPEPPRSACVYCPFHSDAQWLHIKNADPIGFQKAVNFEVSLQNTIRQIPRLYSVPYLHASRIPLSDVVFDEEKPNNLINEECEGMCGV